MKRTVLALIMFFAAQNFILADEVKINFSGKRPMPDIRQQSPAMDRALKDEFNRTMGLNEAQIRRAEEIRMRGYNQMRSLVELQRIKFEQLRTNRAKDPEQTKAEINQIRQEIIKVRQNNEKEFESILTNEQRIKYNQIKDKYEKQAPPDFRQNRPPKPEN